MRDSEKGLGFLLGHEEAETKAQRVKEMGDIIRRRTKKEYLEDPYKTRGLPPLDLFKYGTPPKKSELTDKEFQDYLIKSPTKKQHQDAFSMGRSLLKVSETEKNKMADEWMRGGGRDPHGRSLDEEIKLGKDMWLEKQRVAEKKKDYPRVTNKDDPLLEAAELKKAEMLVSKANARMVTQLTNLKNWANNSKNKKQNDKTH